ncbi:MAG: hypothetical protein RL362_531, partial [Bacteroidota bacterium]
MKRIIIFSILCVCALNSIAQRKQFFETTDEKGRLLMKGIYVNGLEDSLWKFYEAGVLAEESWYYQGKLMGPSIKYYPDGKKMIEAHFILGVQDSTQSVYAPDGSLKEFGRFQDGKKVGRWIQFSGSDTTMIEEYQANRVLLWKKCNPAKDGRYAWCTVIQGTGEVDEKIPGEMRKFTQYKNGLPNGQFVEYYNNGNPKVKGQFVDGLKNGDWKEFFVNGNIKEIVGYALDTLQGKMLAYDNKGGLTLEGEHQKGKKTGHWKWYFMSGNVEMEGDFEEDLQTGVWKYYYTNGQISETGNYEKGKRQGDWEFYYKDGMPWKKGGYLDNQKNSLWTTWFESGQVLQEGHYE